MDAMVMSDGTVAPITRLIPHARLYYIPPIGALRTWVAPRL